MKTNQVSLHVKFLLSCVRFEPNIERIKTVPNIMCHKILQRTMKLVHADTQNDGRMDRCGETNSGLKLTRRG